MRDWVEACFLWTGFRRCTSCVEFLHTRRGMLHRARAPPRGFRLARGRGGHGRTGRVGRGLARLGVCGRGAKLVLVLGLLCTMTAGEQTELDRASRSNIVLRERPGGSGCVAGVPQPGHEYHLCLGPGPLCKGGEYLGGSGARPVCRYPATPMGYVILVILISVLMSFQSFRHWLLQLVPRSYLPVVQAIFGELSSLGFVSLVAFIFEGASANPCCIPLLCACRF